jgi:hypothetical protein
MAANMLLQPSLITNETLVILENNLVAAGKVNRQFENQFVKIGTTLTIRKPNKFLVTSGPGLAIQNIIEPQTSITINSQQHIDFLFSSVDLTLVIEEFSERYLKPIAAKLANKVDMDVLANYSQVANFVGSPGSTPNNFSYLAAVGQRMDEGAVPQDGRVLILNSAANWGIAGALINTYVRSVAEPAYKGFLAAIANMEIYLDQNVPRQTVGAWGSTTGSSGPRINATAGQTGSTILTDQWPSSAAILTAGDVITIAGVDAVNPESLADTGALMDFVVTANTSSTGTTASVPISPAITTTGAFQNVTAAPGAHALINVIDGVASTSYPQNLAFVKDAFGLVTVPMELPDGVDFKAREMYKNVSMRVIRQYDINNDWTPCRVDVLYGTATFYPELAVRLSG